MPAAGCLKRAFYGCYLLQSKQQGATGRTYIGCAASLLTYSAAEPLGAGHQACELVQVYCQPTAPHTAAQWRDYFGRRAHEAVSCPCCGRGAHLVSIALSTALTTPLPQVPALGHGACGPWLPNTGPCPPSWRASLPSSSLAERAAPHRKLWGSTQVQALQFEWAWQHPDKSKALREAYAAIRKADLKGVRGKVHCLG